MRLILLLLVVVAIGIAASQMLKSSVPVAAPKGASAPGAALASREALRQFGEDVNRQTQDAAAERARQTEDAAR